MKSQDKQYLDITLYEVALFYLRKKRIKPTSGNLFWIMKKILNKCDYINKNTKQAKIKFKKGHCEINENS